MLKICKKCGEPYKLQRCRPCARIWEEKYRKTEAYKKKLQAYALNNKEKLKAKNASNYLKNRERILKNKTIYDKENAERKKEYKRINAAKINELSRKRYRENKAIKEMALLRYHTRRKNSKGVLSKDIKQKLYKLQNGKCACCKEPLGKRYHLDHIMPIALGGHNIDSNMQLLKSKCNLSKSAKHPIDYMQSQGFLI